MVALTAMVGYAFMSGLVQVQKTSLYIFLAFVLCLTLDVAWFLDVGTSIVRLINECKLGNLSEIIFAHAISYLIKVRFPHFCFHSS